MSDKIKILAIESSCDETAAAVVENGRCVRSNIISYQIELHKLYGGVVQEIASRKPVSYTHLNGDGLRAVLWVAGCTHKCKGCHNPVTWDIEGGIHFDEAAQEELFEALKPDLSLIHI